MTNYASEKNYPTNTERGSHKETRQPQQWKEQCQKHDNGQILSRREAL